MLTLLFGLLMLVLGVLELYLTKQAVKTYERYNQSHATPFKLWGVSYGYYIGAALILLSLGPIITGISSIIYKNDRESLSGTFPGRFLIVYVAIEYLVPRV